MQVNAGLSQSMLNFMGCSLLLLMVACGANNSSYKPTTDVVESRAKIHFDVAGPKGYCNSC